MKFEIKSRWTGDVLFSIETETWKLAVEAAVKSRANLSGANLSGADLTGANLTRANLTRANLTRASGLGKFPVQIGGHKHWLCTTGDGQLRIGCHVYSFEDWQKHADAIGRKEGYSALDVEIYRKHIQHIKEISELLWKKQEKERAHAEKLK
jgi:hypothetical protein